MIREQSLSTLQKQLSLLDHIPVGECVLQRDGTVLFWNSCLEDWTAISRAQIIGRKIDNVFPHLAHSKYTRRLRETFDGGFTVIFSSQIHPHLIPCSLMNGQLRVQHTIVTAIPASDGIGYHALLSIQDVTDLTRQIRDYKTIQDRAWMEVKQRQSIEEQLRCDRDLLDAILNSSAAAIVVTDRQGNIIFANAQSETMLELHRSTAPGVIYETPSWNIIDLDTNRVIKEPFPWERVIATEKPIFDIQRAIAWADGRHTFLSINGAPLRNETGDISGVVCFVSNITVQKQAIEELRLRYEQECLVDRIVQHMRKSLNLREILQTTVTEIQDFLGTDRVLIYRASHSENVVRIIAEACCPTYPSLLAHSQQGILLEQFDSTNSLQSHSLFHIQAINDISQANFEPGYCRFLQQFSVKARLSIPICLGSSIKLNDVQQKTEYSQRGSSHLDRTQANCTPTNCIPENLWGWLVVHDCQTTRQWKQEEIDLLKKLESQLAVAIYQSELHQQVQHLNITLERQVLARTLELQQALSFESTLKRITDKVRDSLDENQILHTAVEELAKALEVYFCDTTLYTADRGSSTIRYKSLDVNFSADEESYHLHVENLHEVYDQLFRGQPVAFCWLPSSEIKSSSAILACPIIDDQGILGDLWLFKPKASSFSHLEIRLVQQVANQCAIAIRQAQLYKSAQEQVKELARLNHLKDDFLSTISHELRTPIASIRMALQTLEMLFNRSKTLKDDLNQANQYFHIMEDECQREAKLIDDLLSLTRLDAGTEPLMLVPIQLQNWLPHIAEVFDNRIREQQQTLQLNLPSDLPPLVTDLSILERILVELLNNACKYTPPGETIAVSAQLIDDDYVTPEPSHTQVLDSFIDASEFQVFNISSSPCVIQQRRQHFQICVTNTGIEIPPSELPYVFEKFYRIPNHDPWKYGGTGLGLALVKRMAEYLGGIIDVSSEHNTTCFTLKLMIDTHECPTNLTDTSLTDTSLTDTRLIDRGK